ncbi:unnamed protein product [Cuscuta campestris]|uniref:CCHC-type domain-containing protein n=1 Tax=Cuscuta campestris TaxID=132261 RepID=A0A484KUY6_9ASTE|nr:unnamed protein product [Cuscuta campestris]
MANRDIQHLQATMDNLELGEEEIGISFEADSGIHTNLGDDQTWNIVGRLLTDKPIKFDIFKNVIASVWKPAMGVQITQGEEGILWFRFFHPKDAERILDDGPWSYDNAMLLCVKATVGDNIRPADLNFLDIWVQVYGLPFGYTSKGVLEAVGNFLGRFIMVDDRNLTKPYQSFMRVRVSIDVRRPLKRRMKLTKRDGSTTWVTFKYERLGTFCYFCGILGHLGKHCASGVQSGMNPETWPYDDNIRAGGKKKLAGRGAPWLRDMADGDITGRSSISAKADKSSLEGGMEGLITKRKRRNNDEMIVDMNITAHDAGLNDTADVTMEGYPYTWEWKKGTPDWVGERLDRAVVSPCWRDMFPRSRLVNKLSRCGRAFSDRIHLCGEKLEGWGKSKNGDTTEKISHLRGILERLRGVRSPAAMTERINITKEIDSLMDKNDCYWRQRAKQHWLTLRAKGVDIEPNCRICGAPEESVEHVFLSCPFAQATWRLLHREIATGMHENFNNCLAAVFGSASAVGGAVMAAGIWAIWKARNQACWEIKVVRPEVAADWAREVCVARTSRDLQGGTMATSEGSGLQQLNRPDLLRCFVDAAMFEQDGFTSVAAALLDGAGTFIGGFNKLVTCPLVPRYVETLAIKEALSWLKEKNVHDVAVFSDCVQAVHALKNDVIEARSYLNAVEDDCKKLAYFFDYVNFFHIPRQSNLIAHTLARLAVNGCYEWHSIPPNDVLHLL